MTLIDTGLAAVLNAYRTCEFATLGRDGTPLAWPTATHLRADGTLLVTTSPAFPHKALNVRRDGRVALLFSDPTGSGLADPSPVLVTGRARCPEEIVTSPAGLEEYWTRLFERQPMSRRYVTFPLNRVMDWYYMRLLITVEPEKVVVGGSPAQAEAGAPRRGEGPLGAGILARFPTAVLGAVDETGAPLLTRTAVTPVEDGFAVRADPELALVPGPASLLVHRHDDKLSGLYNALVRGRLAALGGDRWLLTPERVVEPNGSGRPADAFRLLRQTRRAAARYLEQRGVERPTVPWAEYQRLT